MGPLSLNPSLLDVPLLANGETYKQSLTLKSDSDPFKIVEVSTEEKGPKLSVETVEAGREYRIHIEVTANRRRNKLLIKTDNSDQPLFKVLFFGKEPVKD
jgi:hypothetical protein